MESMRCLSLGISDAPPLEFLQGAANGARAFGDWAKDLGIPTEVLVDDERPVGFDTVKAAFERLFAGRPRISRLLIYFAGHGLTRDPAEDLWLLSQWFTSQRAVSVGQLCRRLSRYGVEQLTVVSDACRSLAATTDSADLAIDPILDKGPFDVRLPSIDMLRASSPFHAAYMVRGATPDEDRCIFSGLLTEALSGAHEEAFEAPDRRRISNFSLADFLSQQVPLRASQYQVELTPDIATGLRPPNNIYLASRPAAPPVLKSWPEPSIVGEMSSRVGGAAAGRGWSTFSAKPVPKAKGFSSSIRHKARSGRSHYELNYTSKLLVDRDAEAFALSLKQQEKKVARILREYASENDRPTHFVTGAGFNVAGANGRRATLGRSARAVRETTKSWWRIDPIGASYLSLPAPLLIEFDNGNWGGAAALPDHVATFTVEGEEVVSVIYRLLNAAPTEARDTELAIAQLRAGALSARMGYDQAARLRDQKERDPVRAVIAAYIYDALGDRDSIHRIAWYLAAAGIPVPYDVALLGRLRSRQVAPGLIEVEIPETPPRKPRSHEEARRTWTFNSTPSARALVAGIFPWLRQGWSLLEDDEASGLVMEGLVDLRAELLRSSFSTLSARGGQQLKTIIEEM
ncbi:biotin-(acetyl-CoA carboxylase) ligase [Bradyrhizobium sp. JR1.5]|uniref:hypothetical protein n=1 Tax=unclassified Bradyrhizobium TaxID=2631580 RepID=UPI0033944AC3